MAKQLQLRRGTTIQNAAFTGAVGELTMDTEKNQLRLHDGVTQGGHIFGDTIIEWQVPTAENGYTWYRKYRSGWVEQGGIVPYQSTSGNVTVTLPITMSSTNYQTSSSLYGDTSGHEGAVNATYFSIWNRTTTSFTTKAYNTQDIQQMWEVKGMAA